MERERERERERENGRQTKEKKESMRRQCTQGEGQKAKNKYAPWKEQERKEQRAGKREIN